MGDAGEHARHDPIVVAAATDRGGTLPAILRVCRNCVDLYADLALLTAAVPSAAIPRRPRDYRLSAADAARLRARGWRRIIGAFGSARDEVSRPLAIGFATLGVAGLLLTAAPSLVPMGGAAASAPPPMIEQAAPSGAPAVPYAAPGDAPRDAKAAPPGDAPTAGPLLLVSGAFLGVGGTILVARALTVDRRQVR